MGVYIGISNGLYISVQTGTWGIHMKTNRSIDSYFSVQIGNYEY